MQTQRDITRAVESVIELTIDWLIPTFGNYALEILEDLEKLTYDAFEEKYLAKAIYGLEQHPVMDILREQCPEDYSTLLEQIKYRLFHHYSFGSRNKDLINNDDYRPMLIAAVLEPIRQRINQHKLEV